MRDALLNYGMFASFGIFAVAGWMAASSVSGGVIPGAHGAPGAVTGPLAIACLIMAIHCLTCLVKEAR